VLRPFQQLRQFRYARCNPSRLVFGHEISRNTSAWFGLEVDIRHGEIVGVADDEGRRQSIRAVQGEETRQASSVFHYRVLASTGNSIID